MRRKASLILKPGTIFVLVVTALLGLGMYSWANTSIGQTGNQSIEDQETVIGCSTLKIDRINLETNSTHAEIYFEVNRDVNEVTANFRGESNVTRSVEDVEEASLQSLSAEVSDFSKVSLKAASCGQIFHFE